MTTGEPPAYPPPFLASPLILPFDELPRTKKRRHGGAVFLWRQWRPKPIIGEPSPPFGEPQSVRSPDNQVNSFSAATPNVLPPKGINVLAWPCLADLLLPFDLLCPCHQHQPTARY